ncbi:phenylalanine--tRNA ligase subunit beta [Nodosilinea sp. LEGE 07298]|uniref:phenylalanine--tRNA ligase subunit beta n=1 Tax=Nodosilinea sp. LEGE 07298 TaxID=2777970 RepID=UPI0018814B64|nr:phenylalanine--tRNA ligase subunit beta [Nodosilinea sp. LEGE 07298]MBE9108799.1 phenylalanine--tRNA ligase subunit beta [Nodosilinea sp. LEGE 07298]
MRISLNWLNEYVNVQLSPEELADALTMAGFEVEDIEDRRTWADGVVVGRVVDRTPHPDADKLSVCVVDIGQADRSTIVCGAANVRADIYVAVATVNTHLPVVDLTIKPRKLRGVPSEGMICSLAELGLAKDSEGIHIFAAEELELGQDVRPLLGLDDIILDVTSTANRADALSMVGIAREVAAITGATLRLPVTPSPAIPENQAALAIALTDEKACPIYMGTVLENIELGPSPQWLQQRLVAAGTRPINNVVDITNYVLLEWGQPLHAFDRDRLPTTGDGLTLGVRYAQPGETLVTLDSQKRQLQPETLLITANDQPVALAGVMGGEATEVHDGTQAILLEAAFFDAAAIRKSARSQGLRTEASARYERGVNPAELGLACDRALQLLQELAGATVVAQTVGTTALGAAIPERVLTLRLGRVAQLLGKVVNLGDTPQELPPETIQRLLETLGCQVAPADDAGVWAVTVPAYRYRDLEREVDLIEEVARLYGYNHFADTLPQRAVGGYLSVEAALRRRLREAFRAAGLTELLHYSLTKPISDRQVTLANPLFPEYSALRQDLVDGLIEAYAFNLNQGNGPLNGFEIGHIFWQDDDGIHEAEAVGGIVGGDGQSSQWVTGGQDQPLTWYEAKGILDSVFHRLGLAVDYRADSTDPRFHPGRTASLWVRGRLELGRFGQLHPQLRQQRQLPAEVYVFQLNWSALETCLVPVLQKSAKFAAYSTFPASDRDLAFYAPLEVPVADLTTAMAKAGGKLLESVDLFDEYRGETVPEGQRSLAFRLVYRSPDQTLTDDTVDPVHQKVRAALEKQFKVTLRS